MFDSLANLIVYQWLGMNTESHAGTALHFFIMDTTKIFFLLFVIIYIMGPLTGFARRQSREKLQRNCNLARCIPWVKVSHKMMMRQHYTGIKKQLNKV